MTQIQAFVGRTTHELTERVNEWLLANERDIVLLNFLHGNASNDLSLIIVYSKNDSILQEIKSK